MGNKMIENSEELKMAAYLKERERYERLGLKPWVNNWLTFFALMIFVSSGVMAFFLGYTLLSFLSTGLGLFLFDYLVRIQKLKDLGVERCQEMIDLVAKDEDVKRYRDAVVEKGCELFLFDLYKAREITKQKAKLRELESVREVCRKAHGLSGE